jgi:hypothetical protein
MGARFGRSKLTPLPLHRRPSAIVALSLKLQYETVAYYKFLWYTRFQRDTEPLRIVIVMQEVVQGGARN